MRTLMSHRRQKPKAPYLKLIPFSAHRGQYGTYFHRLFSRFPQQIVTSKFVTNRTVTPTLDELAILKAGALMVESKSSPLGLSLGLGGTLAR